MALVSDIVGRALRLLRVINPTQPVKPTDFTTARDALNAMLTRWEASGVALGWSNVTAPDDVMPTPAEAEEAIVYNLALRLRPEYSATLEPDVVAMAREGWATLVRDQQIATPLERANCGWGYDTYTDSYV